MAAPATNVSFGPRFHPRTAPVTFWFLIIAVTVWLLSFFVSALMPLLERLVFTTGKLALNPWSPFTYSFVHPRISPFSMLLLGYVFWWSGADNERWWGSRVQAGFLLAVAVATALMLQLGASLTGLQDGLMGGEAMLCGSLTVWALRNLRTPVILLIVPVSGAVLLALEVAIMWFDHGPVMGFFAVLGSAGLATLYYYQGHHLHRLFRGGGGGSRGKAKGKAREQRQRDKRFRDIMERSGLRLVEDDEEPKR